MADKHESFDCCCVVLCTVPSKFDVKNLASHLVGQHLAACVNIIPKIHSIYTWKGKIENDDEQLLIIKTTKACFSSLVREIRAQHPYKVPEIIALPISEGWPDYLQWLRHSCLGPVKE
ncbi:MAG: divalent-cation tolerance protein CutA [Gammaproteobacteria bacterium]|nr:divalent-cation tolerance protein CutA [Gammaproteobacteria bacterium]